MLINDVLRSGPLLSLSRSLGVICLQRKLSGCLYDWLAGAPVSNNKWSRPTHNQHDIIKNRNYNQTESTYLKTKWVFTTTLLSFSRKFAVKISGEKRSVRDDIFKRVNSLKMWHHLRLSKPFNADFFFLFCFCWLFLFLFLGKLIKTIHVSDVVHLSLVTKTTYFFSVIYLFFFLLLLLFTWFILP